MSKIFSEYVLFVYVVLNVGHVACFNLKETSRLKVESWKENVGNVADKEVYMKTFSRLWQYHADLFLKG